MPEGRNPRVKKAFLALSRKSKSPISTLRDEDNATLILSLHMQGRVQSSVGCTLLTIYATAWGICFSVHFCYGVWRCQLINELDKSLRFSCIQWQTQFMNC